MDFTKRVKLLNESTGSEVLFNLQEQAEKRRQLATDLEQNFVSKMQGNLGTSIWHRIFQKPPGNIEVLRQIYQDRGKEREFDREFNFFLGKTEEANQRSANGLFNQQERAVHLIPQLLAERRLFRRRQERKLHKYKQFDELASSLPNDDLDLQLKQLADDYHYIGRSRVWFYEFEKMIDEVFGAVNNMNDRQNESVVRLLQNDFLLTMQSKFSTYWRYHELRQYCFEHNYTDMVTRFGYFQDRVQNRYQDGASVTALFARWQSAETNANERDDQQDQLHS